jgi:hypothetical protein
MRKPSIEQRLAAARFSTTQGGRKTMLKSALLLGAGIAIGAGAIQGLHAATGSTVYSVYEANITDEAA